MSKKYHFIYLITNLINGKQYIGDHSTNNINDSYLGSGKLILRARQKHGKINFERKILEFFNSKKEAFDAQEKYINEYNTLVPNGYNISPTGGTECGGFHSHETIEKIIFSNKTRIISDETREKMRKNNTGTSNPFFGKKHSEEGLTALRNAQIGRKKSDDEKNKIRLSKIGTHLSETAKEKISKFNKGKKLSEITKNKISNKLKGKIKPKILCTQCNKYIDVGNFYRWHDVKCKSYRSK